MDAPDKPQRGIDAKTLARMSANIASGFTGHMAFADVQAHMETLAHVSVELAVEIALHIEKHQEEEDQVDEASKNIGDALNEDDQDDDPEDGDDPSR